MPSIWDTTDLCAKYRLESVLLAQAKYSDAVVRQSLVKMLIHRHEPRRRALILSFLNDEKDEVRECVLNEINERNWPDALAIDAKYIKATQPEGAHHKSVVSAKRYTNPKDNARSEQISQMSTRPDAQKQYLKYIAQHRNDPDYEVSVDTAQRFYESIQINLSSERAVAEEKKRADMLHKAVPQEERGVHAPQRPFADQVDFMVWVFDTKDSSTSQYACRYFDLVTPTEEQPRLLTAIAKRATQAPVNNEVLKNVLVVAEHQPAPSPRVGVWDQELEAIVWEQRSNADGVVREYIIRVLDGWRSVDWRNRVLSFLDDRDAQVREGCAYTISNTWPDYREIFTRYITEHRQDPDCEGTIYVMQTVLKDREKSAEIKAESDQQPLGN